MTSDIKWTDMVECPRCGAKMQLKTLRHVHLCGRKAGRPRKHEDPGMDNYQASVAALDRRLALRAGRVSEVSAQNVHINCPGAPTCARAAE